MKAVRGISLALHEGCASISLAMEAVRGIPLALHVGCAGHPPRPACRLCGASPSPCM